MRLLITGGFRGRPIQKRHFWLQRSKGRCHGNQILAKTGQKNHKNGHNLSCKRHIHAVWFWVGFVPSGNSSVTLPYKTDKVALLWRPILGQKLLWMHTNAFLREITRTQLLITGGFCGRPIQRRHFWLQGFQGHCHGNQFLAKIGKISQNGHNFSCMQHICAEFCFKMGLCYQGIYLWHSRTQRTKGCHHGNQFWDKNCYKCT